MGVVGWAEWRRTKEENWDNCNRINKNKKRKKHIRMKERLTNQCFKVLVNKVEKNNQINPKVSRRTEIII